MTKKSKNHIRFSNTILIPTDFSEVCEHAVYHGIELARFLNFRVCILHVVNPEINGNGNSGASGEDRVEKYLRKCKEVYGAYSNIEIEVLSREGNFIKVINKVAVEIKANLMIMGTHGKQGLQHLFGSHALKVVLDSPCPVVVVQGSYGKGYRDIVLPVSGEIVPHQSIEWILLMSRLFGSKIHIFQSPETDPELEKRMKSVIGEIIKILEEKKVPYTIRMAETTRDFSSQVIAHAVAITSDLILIMTMPGEHLPGFNFAEWNEKLMFNEAQIPVMCVNPLELGKSYAEWMPRS
jgi:nucleotide-binding universal stress UspA family protein